MATAATSLLGLALPVTGELSGTWGDTVNVSITALLDTAVAGTTTLSSDADVTLTTTTLAANQARQAIILWTAGGTVTRTITVPAQSKSYIVINKTSSSQSIKIVGVGPTTGVTIVAGTAAFVVWNGVDFVTVSVTSTTGILPVANGGTGLSSGTSGGVLAYTATGTLASSAALAASALVIGGGAGAAPSTTTTGTGVVTALGVNTGTAGAFVVNGGALGTPSSGTVTNLTGTASININGTVGATTANTGAFTTLSATNAGTQTPTFTSTVNGSIAELILVGKNSTGTARQVNFGINRFADDVWSLSNGTTEYLRGSLTSGGLAVTGTLTSTVAAAGNFTTLSASGRFEESLDIRFMNEGYGIVNAANTARIMTFNNTSITTSVGLAVTGTLSATGTLSGGTSGTGYSFDGSAPAGSLSLISGGRFGIGMSLPTSKLTIGNDSFTAAASNTTGMYTGANGLIVLSDGLFIATRAGVDRVILDTSGNLGLGVTPNTWYLNSSVYGAIQFGSGSLFYGKTTAGAANLDLIANSYLDASGTYRYLFSAATTKFTQSAGSYYWYSAVSGTAGDTVSFGTEKMKLDSSGNLTISNGNLIVGTDGKGIDFSATSSGSGTMTSELLADYEEGTWTPNQGVGLTVVGAFSSSGTYTKIGRLVTFRGVVSGATSVATSANAVISTNLPFSAATIFTGTIMNDSATSSGGIYANGATVVSTTAFTATPALFFSATYFV